MTFELSIRSSGTFFSSLLLVYWFFNILYLNTGSYYIYNKHTSFLSKQPASPCSIHPFIQSASQPPGTCYAWAVFEYKTSLCWFIFWFRLGRPLVSVPILITSQPASDSLSLSTTATKNKPLMLKCKWSFFPFTRVSLLTCPLSLHNSHTRFGSLRSVSFYFYIWLTTNMGLM